MGDRSVSVTSFIAIWHTHEQSTRSLPYKSPVPFGTSMEHFDHQFMSSEYRDGTIRDIASGRIAFMVAVFVRQ